MLDTLVKWLIGLSDSQVRAFRHTSTLACERNSLSLSLSLSLHLIFFLSGLKLVTGMVHLVISLATDIDTAQVGNYLYITSLLINFKPHYYSVSLRLSVRSLVVDRLLVNSLNWRNPLVSFNPNWPSCTTSRITYSRQFLSVVIVTCVQR